MNPHRITKTRSVWPSLQVRITHRKQWTWIGICKPTEPHSPRDASCTLSYTVLFAYIVYIYSLVFNIKMFYIVPSSQLAVKVLINDLLTYIISLTFHADPWTAAESKHLNKSQARWLFNPIITDRTEQMRIMRHHKQSKQQKEPRITVADIQTHTHTDTVTKWIPHHTWTAEWELTCQHHHYRP